MDPLDVPACAVSIESEYAISAANKYLELVEAQMSQTEADLHSAATAAYRRIAQPHEMDYDDIVGCAMLRGALRKTTGPSCDLLPSFTLCRLTPVSFLLPLDEP